jgi:hypothetical protein
MSRNLGRLLFWSPRVLTIAFAIFLCLFALDVFKEGHGFWQTAMALMVHLIPAAIIVAVLIVAWRWEWVGAVLFIAAAAFYAAKVLPRHPDWALAVAGPLVPIAFLPACGMLRLPRVRH